MRCLEGKVNFEGFWSGSENGGSVGWIRGGEGVNSDEEGVQMLLKADGDAGQPYHPGYEEEEEEESDTQRPSRP